MLIVNELLQWAAILFVGVFVVGLTRQLGQFMVSPKEHAAIEEGPATGRSLPRDLLGEAESERFRDLVDRSEWGVGTVLVVREECTSCTRLLEHVAQSQDADRPPLLVLSFGSTSIHAGLVEAAGDLFVEDEDRLVRAGFRSTPFVLLVDEHLKVLHKEVTIDLDQAIANWRASASDHGQELTVTKVAVDRGEVSPDEKTGSRVGG